MVSYIQDGQPRRLRLDPRDAHRLDQYGERKQLKLTNLDIFEKMYSSDCALWRDNNGQSNKTLFWK